MAYNELNSKKLPGRNDVRWFHEETVADGTSDPLVLPSVGKEAVVLVNPGTNAKVQYTMVGYDFLETTTDWFDWPHGEVTATTADSISVAVTALRLVSTGSSTWWVNVSQEVY